MVNQINDSNLHFATVMNKFPRVGKIISLYWGQPEFAPYVYTLIHDNRNGKRQGFPFDVAMALTELQQLHDETFPLLIPKQRDPWSSDYAK